MHFCRRSDFADFCDNGSPWKQFICPLGLQYRKPRRKYRAGGCLSGDKPCARHPQILSTETEPVDVRDQGWFLNCVLEAETDLTPLQLIEALLEIERSLGRARRVFRGPRTIDMDILLFGSRVVNLPNSPSRIRG